MVRDSQPDPADLPIRLSAVDTLVESPISGSSPLPGLKEIEPRKINPIVPLSLDTPASVPDSMSTPEPIVKTPGNPNPQKTKISKPADSKQPKVDNPQQSKPDKPPNLKNLPSLINHPNLKNLPSQINLQRNEPTINLKRFCAHLAKEFSGLFSEDHV